MQPLSSLDAQFLAAERGNYGSHYCGLAIYQTGDRQPITAATMRQRLAERMGHCPPLRWKVIQQLNQISPPRRERSRK